MEGRWGKVKALQHLLTRSHSGKMLAVKRVTENRGKRTPGVDGKIWSTPAAKWSGMESTRHRSYRALPLRRIYIPKSNGQKRPLGIPRMLCRSMQALWKLALEPVSESLADPNSYGFRPNRSTADAIEYCFITLAKRTSPVWVLEGDIRGCFDNFSHEWMLKNIPMDKTILRRWLQAGFIDEGTLFATQAGTPQGGIISPVIANMALDGNRPGISPCMEISTFFTHLSDLMNPMVLAKMAISFPLLRWAYAKFRSVVNGFFGYGERIMLAVGISLLAVGLGTGNPGLWIPGCVFAAIGCSQRVKRRG